MVQGADHGAARLQPAVHAGPGLPAPVERVSESELQRVRDQTAAGFRAATAAGVAVDVAVDIGQPATAILDCSVRLPADLIVMGTHGAGGFEHFVLGSVAEKVLRRAACPVLTVPPRAHATSVLPFKRVLCAVDFSDASLDGAALRLSLARGIGAALTLLHVIEWPWEEPPPPVLDGAAAGAGGRAGRIPPVPRDERDEAGSRRSSPEAISLDGAV